MHEIPFPDHAEQSSSLPSDRVVHHGDLLIVVQNGGEVHLIDYARASDHYFVVAEAFSR